MASLNVGLFNDSYPPVMDGVANVVLNYARHLNARHGRATVITVNAPGAQDTEPFDVIRYFSLPIPFRPPFRFGFPQVDFAMKRKLRSCSFDLIHAHCPAVSGTLALKESRRRNVPIVTTFHSKFYDDLCAITHSETIAKMVTRLYLRDFYNRIDAVWSVSDGTAETLRSYGYKGHIEVVRNGSDFVAPANPEAMRQRVNAELGLHDSDTMLLFVGQHIWHKGIRCILEAAACLKRLGTPFTLVFVGSGPDAAAIEALTRELGLSDQVKFLGLMLDRDYLKAIYGRANLFVFPSMYDNAPIVVREAAAMGCPSMVLEGSNSSEGIVDGENGFTTPNDSEALGQKLSRLLVDKAGLAVVGKRAQETVFLSWSTIVDDVAERYADIIARFKREGRKVPL